MTIPPPRHPASLVDQLTRNPNLYLAGKIHSNDWRVLVIPNIRQHSWTESPLVHPRFNYLGPFTVGCNHGCRPGSNAHGNVIGCCFDQKAVREEVVKHCLNAVDRCDLVFCYIERLDCHGTIVELARAHAQGIPVVIAFAPGVADADNNEMWFPSMLATQVYFGVSRCQLPSLVNKSIKELAW